MKSAYWKDIWQSIIKGKKRFLSIVVIAALGVTMMCGLRASCVDLRYSADAFFDEQNLFDIRILSTLGLTEQDIEALGTLQQVEHVEGGYNETAYTMVDQIKKSIEIRTLSEDGVNLPYLLDGRLPEKTNEIVITKTYKNETGKGVGDQIVLTEQSETLTAQKYEITGIVIDALDVNSTEGSMGFRSTAATDYVGYIVPEGADNDIFTVVYLRMKDLEELNCYSEDYATQIDGYVHAIEKKIKKDREEARYDEIYGDAMEEWEDGEKEMLDEFAKADKEIEDAKKKLADGKKELENAKRQLLKAEQELRDGEAELNRQKKEAEKQFAAAWKEIEAGEAELAAGIEEYESMKQMYDEIKGTAQGFLTEVRSILQQMDVSDDISQQITQIMNATNSYLAQVEQRLLENPNIPEDAKAQIRQSLSDVKAYLPELEKKLHEANVAGEIKSTVESMLNEVEGIFVLADKELANAYAQIEAGRNELEAGKAELRKQEANAKAQISAGYAKIRAGWAEVKNGWLELASGAEELEEGEAELEENLDKYLKEKEKAEKELADALDEINDIDMTKWYVQDRTSLSGYTNVKSDADSIQAIGDIFPVLFLTVAILISLTTITRMVEEERGLIGTYKALGFSDAEIRRKYVIYAALACLIGGILGDIAGYIILPYILFIVFGIMYTIPKYLIQFDLLFGLGGILLFEIGVVGATMFSCRKALIQMPAILMRPKAPKSGSRVLLERITFIWRRMSFLNKVTARNLFRYKKRLFMTVFGIAGCTALLLCGFTIKDTVAEMLPQQYEHIYKYGLMAVTADDDVEELKNLLNEDEEIADYISIRIDSVTLLNQEEEETAVQLMVIPESVSLEGYIYLRDRSGQEIPLKDGDVFVTKNATRVLDLKEGDAIRLQTMDLQEADAQITSIVENYFGNSVYMTQNTYEQMFDEFKCNGVLAVFSEEFEDHMGYTEELLREECILSATSTQEMIAEFDSAFALLNMVVYVILVLAALLAFVVLFTLSNTNISERERELATIKVLGFYNPEVHSYVNKETWILTSIGIVAGMPLGWILGRYVMGILELPSLEFYIELYPVSYLYAAAITLVFAFMVNAMTDKTLDKINMVEALKSVE